VAVSYLAAALGLLDAILPGIQQEKRFNWHKFILVLVFSLFLGIPGAFDLAFGTNSLVWVGLSAALLYTYCYIISLDLHSDALTGIGNRFAFDEFIEKLSRKKKKEEWGLIMLDMDRLKEINDTLGHLSGDRALCDMAGIITSCINFDDFAARYGGDEFIIVTQGCPKTLMARIQQGITDFNETQGRSYKIQMSYGFDTFTTGSHTLMQDLVCHVDSLMYKQKKYKTERRRIVEAFGVEAGE
jgi:diguanylate cyclase (GGDEF)-like protein